MADNSVIMVMGTECPSASEEAWSRWYTEKHVPDVLKFKGVKAATRYQIRDDEEARAQPSCPKYVAIYRFETWKAVEGYNKSKEREVAVKDWNENWVPRGARLVWRIYYEPIKSWGDDPRSKNPRNIILVGTECKQGIDDEWNKWYSGRHVPDVLKFKDLKKASRYHILKSEPPKGVAAESAAQYPSYLTIYEFDSLKDVDAYNISPELKVAHDDWVKWVDSGRAKLIWRTCYVPIKSWSK